MIPFNLSQQIRTTLKPNRNLYKTDYETVNQIDSKEKDHSLSQKLHLFCSPNIGITKTPKRCINILSKNEQDINHLLKIN